MQAKKEHGRATATLPCVKDILAYWTKLCLSLTLGGLVQAFRLTGQPGYFSGGQGLVIHVDLIDQSHVELIPLVVADLEGAGARGQIAGGATRMVDPLGLNAV